MTHLDSERLAELADAEPTADELRHLSACRTCSADRTAQQRLRQLSREWRSYGSDAPLTTWVTLGERLEAEGLMRPERPTQDGHTHPRTRAARAAWRGRRSGWGTGPARAIAAALLIAVGAAGGRLTAPRPSAPRTTAPVTGGALRATAGAAPSPRRAGRTTPASSSFRDQRDALATLARAERRYRSAAAYLASRDSAASVPVSAARYRARLAALDKVQGAALAALNAVPGDPVLNQYYLSMLGARQMTLRQLGSALPPGVRLTGF